MEVLTLAEIAVDALARGLLFALLGAGITLVFGLGNVLNLSLGVFAVIAVIVGSELVPVVPNAAIAAICGIVAVAALGLATDRALLSSVYRSDGEERILLGIFVTLGLAIMLDGLLYAEYPLQYGIPHGVDTMTVAGVMIRGSSLVVIVVAASILLALFLFLRRTTLGNATRTIFQDETGALLCGINPRRIRSLIFVLSVSLAGVAGILWSLQSTVGAESAFEFTIYAIIVSIVGGVRNIEGTIVAGLLLGFISVFGNYFIGSYEAMILLFAFAVAVLIIRPEEVA
ncbi:branched-chain amino acid ABC transporter permease [Halovivax gelatinilyticus]|uniref:branched-chain amino acid ABC transporter permease n=1 Tax=Halovivax gelatinilyticus TaxID=2961597 RepID=UPI0020CA8F33|nr:branched-chain amino acid ABC transporter permease [Halovivax gelatinilyticus]